MAVIGATPVCSSDEVFFSITFCVPSSDPPTKHGDDGLGLEAPKQPPHPSYGPTKKVDRILWAATLRPKVVVEDDEPAAAPSGPSQVNHV